MNRKIGRSVISGTGSSLPARIVPNEDFLATIKTSDEWIRTRTGIRERRFVGPGESCASLGLLAAKSALAKSGVAADELDLIVFATVTPDWMTPATACSLQHVLGCRPIPAFDIAAACTGFLYAMSIADQYIRAGSARHVLIVGADVLSKVIDRTDRNTCILFGDGAGAAVISASEQFDRGILSVRLYCDGTNQQFVQVPGMVSPTTPEDPKSGQFITMSGREVFKFAVCRMNELIEDARAEMQRSGRKIDLLIPHQVNQRIIDSALEKTGFPADKVIVNLDRYGNTSAASVPIALDEAMSEGRAKRGDTCLLVAFGGGLTWGSAIVTL
jgi:3-oxoacyl-[acyl-carrier-protein] synthase III